MDSSLQRLERAKVALAEARNRVSALEEQFKQALAAYASEVGISNVPAQWVPKEMGGTRKTLWGQRILSLLQDNPTQHFTAMDVVHALQEDKKYLATIKSTLYLLAKTEEISKYGTGLFTAKTQKE